MQVYFDASLWQSSEAMKGKQCEHAQTINAKFQAKGLERIIPVIYCFSKGIVFDILTVMEEKVIMEYVDKYKAAESSSVTLSSVQLEQIWQENPYQDTDGRYWINDSSTGTLSSTSDGYLKGRLLHGDCKSIQILKETYSRYLENAECFFCQRICIEDGKDYTKDKVTELKLVTGKQYRTEGLDVKITVNPPEEGQAAFVHPVTGIRHEIFIYDTEAASFTAWDKEYIYSSGTAEIVPGLSGEESLLFDSNLSYETSVSREEKNARAAAVIGGADGPAAVFFAGKIEEPVVSRHLGEPFPCFSKPRCIETDAEIDGGIVFRITGLKRLIQEEETIQILQQPETK